MGCKARRGRRARYGRWALALLTALAAALGLWLQPGQCRPGEAAALYDAWRLVAPLLSHEKGADSAGAEQLLPGGTLYLLSGDTVFLKLAARERGLTAPDYRASVGANSAPQSSASQGSAPQGAARDTEDDGEGGQAPDPLAAPKTAARAWARVGAALLQLPAALGLALALALRLPWPWVLGLARGAGLLAFGLALALALRLAPQARTLFGGVGLLALGWQLPLTLNTLCPALGLALLFFAQLLALAQRPARLAAGRWLLVWANAGALAVAAPAWLPLLGLAALPGRRRWARLWTGGAIEGRRPRARWAVAAAALALLALTGCGALAWLWQGDNLLPQPPDGAAALRLYTDATPPALWPGPATAADAALATPAAWAGETLSMDDDAPAPTQNAARGEGANATSVAAAPNRQTANATTVASGATDPGANADDGTPPDAEKRERAAQASPAPLTPAQQRRLGTAAALDAGRRALPLLWAAALWCCCLLPPLALAPDRRQRLLCLLVACLQGGWLFWGVWLAAPGGSLVLGPRPLLLLPVLAPAVWALTPTALRRRAAGAAPWGCAALALASVALTVL